MIYMSIDPTENVESMPHSTPIKGAVPSAVATLVQNAKKLPLEDLKHVLSTVTYKIEERRIPLGSPSKPPDSSLAHVHDVSSLLHSLIKEGAPTTNVTKLSTFSGEVPKVKNPLKNGVISYKS